MAKEEYLELSKDVSGFEIESLLMEGAPEGLTAKILWDLWDIGVKFGTIGRKGIYFKLKENGLALEMYKFADKGGSNGFTVAKARPSLLMSEGICILKLKNGMDVMWDNGLTVQDVFEAIEEIDTLAKKKGHIEGDQRKVIDRADKKAGRLSVEGIFMMERGAIMPVMPDLDTKEVLAEFDHPELLDVIEFGVLKFLCLREDKEYILSGMERRARILSDMGLTEKDIGNMSQEQIIELKRKLGASESDDLQSPILN